MVCAGVCVGMHGRCSSELWVGLQQRGGLARVHSGVVEVELAHRLPVRLDDGGGPGSWDAGEVWRDERVVKRNERCERRAGGYGTDCSPLHTNFKLIRPLAQVSERHVQRGDGGQDVTVEGLEESRWTHPRGR